MAAICGTTVYLEIRDYLLVPPRRVDHSIQRGTAMGCLAGDGRARSRGAPRSGTIPGSTSGAGKAPPFLRAAGQPDAPFLRRQPAPRPGRSRPSSDRTANARRSSQRLSAQPPELIFTGYPPFRALRSFLNDALSAVADGPRPVDQARRLRAIRGCRADDTRGCISLRPGSRQVAVACVLDRRADIARAGPP